MTEYERPTISASRLKTMGGEKGSPGCERKTVLYVITNITTGKMYVGITSQKPRRRFRKHVSDALNGSPTYFHRAIRKFGEQAFQMKVEAEFTSRDEANLAERARIAAGPAEYNLSAGGDGCEGVRHTEAAKAKISLARQGMVFSAAHREQISAAQKGVPKPPRTAQHARNLSLALKGHTVTAETRAKLAAAALANPRPRNEKGVFAK